MNSNTQNTFGSSSNTFGSTNSIFQTPFGSTGAFGGRSTIGTGNPPYRITQADEKVIRTQQYYQNTAITAMPEYSTKSFEELRYEDMNKPGGTGVTTTPTASFESATPAANSSLFGSMNSNTQNTIGSSSNTFGSTNSIFQTPSS